jgi:hypothetical protein
LTAWLAVAFWMVTSWRRPVPPARIRAAGRTSPSARG